MIRTKEQLIEALGANGRIFGHQQGRPSAPWSYKIGDVTVHGNAFWAAEKAGLLTCITNHWNHSAYRAKKQ